MTVFAILLPEPQPALVEAISLAFPNDHLALSETQWLVSAALTVQEVTEKIRVHSVKDPSALSVGNAVIFATSSYFGRAPGTVWDWLKSKLEARQNG
ncbi:MAG: hypothetical protein ACRYHQ_28350 [Janthinobacterium lividum]